MSDKFAYICPICRCPRCGKETVFKIRPVVTKAGDNGHASYDSYACSSCGFVPLLLPTVIRYANSDEV